MKPAILNIPLVAALTITGCTDGDAEQQLSE
jgi:hypothetical protein